MERQTLLDGIRESHDIRILIVLFLSVPETVHKLSPDIIQECVWKGGWEERKKRLEREQKGN